MWLYVGRTYRLYVSWSSLLERSFKDKRLDFDPPDKAEILRLYEERSRRSSATSTWIRAYTSIRKNWIDTRVRRRPLPP